MPELWMPNARKIDLGDHSPCDSEYGPKVIAHITADRNASRTNPQAWIPHERLESYFKGSGRSAAPHILWSPFTGQITQFLPATSRSKSLRDLSGGIRTNRAGKVVIQIEAVFFPYCIYKNEIYARLKDTPCRGWEELQNWVSSWGVPKTWPGGIPTALDRDTYTNFAKASGWFGHSQVPENDHVDPGSWPNFITKTPTKPPAKPTLPSTVPAFPGTSYFRLGAYNKYVTAVDNQLIRLGFTKYHDGNGYQAGPRYTEFTRRNVSAFQRSRGWEGSGADGFVGPMTWHDLHTVRK